MAGRAMARNGAALIIALSFVVLLTILVVAFLAHSQLALQLMNARAAETQVDVMSRTAIEFTKGDLRQEIIAGSTNNSAVYTMNGTTIYVPSTNGTIMPSRTGFTPGTPGSDPLDNIVKISKNGSNFFSGPSGYYSASYPSPNWASPVSTGTPALNGRYIDKLATGWSTSGWDKPQLIDTTRYGTTALQSIPFPDWIYVTSTGRQVLSQPTNNVVGRYAFVIYDEGGLLDINVAGYPSSISSPDARDPDRKGPLALADLTQIPGSITSTMKDAIVAWRNQATSVSGTSGPFASTNYPTTNAPDYVKYVLNGALNKGFKQTYPGDQKFLSRQDLLAYSQAFPANLPTQSLAYLTTFSRALNAPTWTPKEIPGESFTPVTFTYASAAENPGLTPAAGQAYNQDAANIRWLTTTTITRPKLDADTGLTDTTVPTETVTFNQGDPLIQHRFPLSKIALLSNPNAQTQSPNTVGSIAWAVKYYFGLQWSNSDGTLAEPHWEYANANNATLANALDINSLSDLALANKAATPSSPAREPDFFELLREGVLRGSAQDIMVLDMAASIIDQFDADDVPTAITNPDNVGPAREAFGKENLPYFSQMLFWPIRPGGATDPGYRRFEAYLVPMFWNPHRNASTASSTVQNFRVTLNPNTNVVCYLTAPSTASGMTSGLTAPATITFSTSGNTYQEPTILTGSQCSPTGGLAIAQSDGRSGFYLGFTNAPDTNVLFNAGQPTAGTTTRWTKANLTQETKGPSCTVQCKDSSGNWHTYENIQLNVGSSSWTATDSVGATNSSGVDSAVPGFSAHTATAINYYGGISLGPVDPRVSAGAGLGASLTQGGSGGIAHTTLFTTAIGTLPAGSTWQPVAPETAAAPAKTTMDTIGPLQFGYFYNSVSLTVPTPNTNYVGMWNENNAASGSYPHYQDYDSIANGVTGDHVMRPGDGFWGANPEATTNITNPYLQDRPIILNRPFRSVGEMGYAYRGVEWRTVDFSSAVSGDSGLLDLFSIGESQKLSLLTNSASSTSPVYTSIPLTAGVVNINTRHPEVLSALVSGSLENDLDTSASTVISSTQANTIANAIVAETAGTSGHGPLINRSDIVNRLMNLSSVTNTLTTVRKPEREAVVRALAEPADTRTWNLLVDLDVQVGSYPPTAIQAGTVAALSQFNVQGERRYWLHLAIDRYTGKVIDEQLEVINDN